LSQNDNGLLDQLTASGIRRQLGDHPGAENDPLIVSETKRLLGDRPGAENDHYLTAFKIQHPFKDHPDEENEQIPLLHCCLKRQV
jgi:hypothetical protein